MSKEQGARNSETLIQDEADKFSTLLEGYATDNDGALKFKDEITGKLQNYHELPDRLIFFRQISKNIDTQFDKHLESCEYKDKPLICPVNNYYLKCKLYTEKSISEINPT